MHSQIQQRRVHDGAADIDGVRAGLAYRDKVVERHAVTDCELYAPAAAFTIGGIGPGRGRAPEFDLV